MRATFKPDQDPTLVPATRYGSKPPFRDTFVNFQQKAGMPGFISETDRLGGRRNVTVSPSGRSAKSIFSQTVTNNLNAKVQYQFDEKARNSMRQEAKMATKRANMERIQSLACEANAKSDTDFANKLMRKAARQDNYNKLCYLAN